jgi:hypothetical protein
VNYRPTNKTVFLHSHSVFNFTTAYNHIIYRLFIGLRRVKNKGFGAFAAILAILVGGHENSSATLLARAFSAESVDLSIFIDLE